MNTQRVWTLAVSLSLALCVAAGATEREISGELVILKSGNRQFRIVDHAGSFTAPAGIALEDFDGKPVRVELASNGRVLSITEKPIETNPMMRHYQIVTGQLVVSNAVSGAFTITGDGRSFLAPVGFDVRPYANQMVDVFLDEQGQVKSIDRARNSALPGAYVAPPMPNLACAYGGQSYVDGSLLCQSGTRYRCETGVWRDLGTGCVSDLTTAGQARSCIVGDATVASGSSVCRAGVTYRCSDGQWSNLGTPCR